MIFRLLFDWWCSSVLIYFGFISFGLLAYAGYRVIKFILEKEEITMNKGCGGILFDFVMTILTGGLWLIWVLIRYLRANS